MKVVIASRAARHRPVCGHFTSSKLSRRHLLPAYPQLGPAHPAPHLFPLFLVPPRDDVHPEILFVTHDRLKSRQFDTYPFQRWPEGPFGGVSLFIGEQEERGRRRARRWRWGEETGEGGDEGGKGVGVVCHVRRPIIEYVSCFSAWS